MSATMEVIHEGKKERRRVVGHEPESGPYVPPRANPVQWPIPETGVGESYVRMINGECHIVLEKLE